MLAWNKENITLLSTIVESRKDASSPRFVVSPADPGVRVRLKLTDRTYGNFQATLLLDRPYAGPAVEMGPAAFFLLAWRTDEPLDFSGLTTVPAKPERTAAMREGVEKRLVGVIDFLNLHLRKGSGGARGWDNFFMVGPWGTVVTDGYRLHRASLLSSETPLALNAAMIRLLSGLSIRSATVRVDEHGVRVYGDTFDLIATNCVAKTENEVVNIQRAMTGWARDIKTPLATVLVPADELRNAVRMAGRGRGKNIGIRIDPDGLLIGLWLSTPGTTPEVFPLDDVTPVDGRCAGTAQMVVDRNYLYDGLRTAEGQVRVVILPYDPGKWAAAVLMHLVHSGGGMVLSGVHP